MNQWVRRIGGAALFLMMALPAQAALSVLSPTIHQTWPEGNLIQNSVRLGPHHHTLNVVVTYANELVADQTTGEKQEDYFFRFPNIPYDADRGLFIYHPEHGDEIVIAERKADGSSTRLRPNISIVIFNLGGKLAAALKINPDGKPMKQSFYETRRPANSSLESLLNE